MSQRKTVEADVGRGADSVGLAGGVEQSRFLLGASSYDDFVWKLTGGGVYVWAGAIGVAGCFHATADFDPGAGVYNLASAGEADVYVLKLDGGGRFLWARGMRAGTSGPSATSEASSTSIPVPRRSQ